MEKNFCIYCMNSCAGGECAVCKRKNADYKAAPHHLQPGTVLNGKYLIGRVLGEGGFGITYIGRDINLDVKVAVKEYYPAGIVNRNNTNSTEITSLVGDAQRFFEKGKSSFLGEARTLAKFADERSVVSVRDFFSENNTAYIVMEYLEGIDLKDYLKRSGPLNFAQTVQMLAPIMQALSKIHSQGLIHRDISPANIMILRDGTVKLLDFGAAREVSMNAEKSLSILLKPGYAPEEQYRTKGKQGPWTDVYALCATMYKMLTGHTPEESMNRIFADELKSICELNPRVTPEEEAIILKGMAVLQMNRYQSIAELYADCKAGYVQSSPQSDVEKTANTAEGQGREEKSSQPAAVSGVSPEQTNKKNENKPAASAVGAIKESKDKSGKKPLIPCFIGSVFLGILALVAMNITAFTFFTEEISWMWLVISVILAGTSVLLGAFYFPRLNNKTRKPNIFCFVAGLVSMIAPIVLGIVSYCIFTDAWADPGDFETMLFLAVSTLAFPIFFGYFYYPRLEKKKKSLFAKIYGGTAALFAVIVVVFIAITGLTTVTVGNEKISRGETDVSLTAQIIPDSDLKKLCELKKLETLEIRGCFLDDSDVEILSGLTQLKQLSIAYNTDITNVDALNKLKNLTYLDISYTKVSDISSLDALTSLKRLDLSFTKVSDLGVVENYDGLKALSISCIDYTCENGDALTATLTVPTTLEELYCESLGLTSLGFINTSDSLTVLNAFNNDISDLSPLSKFEVMSIVDVSANNVSDISPLADISINTIDLSTNSIEDISPLKGTTSYSLDLSYNKITDISPLQDNGKIGIVKLNNNSITDISVLKDCFRIYSLDVSCNQITDISAIATINELTLFSASHNLIEDISPLASCSKLISEGATIDLDSNKISDISVLSKYVNTSHFYLSDNQISDISALSDCVALEMLKLNKNQIKDLSPLYSLPSLSILQVVGNPVENLESFSLNGVSKYTGAATLHISYDEGIDFAALSENEALDVIVYDAPERAQYELSDYGYYSFPLSETLDMLKPNEDDEKIAEQEESKKSENSDESEETDG